MSGLTRLSLALILLLAALTLDLSGQEGTPAPQPAAPQPAAPQSLGTSIMKAYEAIRPAVVTIEASGLARRSDSPRGDLFGDPEAGSIGALSESGAGLIVGPEGIVITHAQLAAFRSPKIIVNSVHGRHPARVLARDPDGDGALLKIEAGAQRFAFARLAKLPPSLGSLVLALGNPFRIARDGRPSLSLGVVSGVGLVAMRVRRRRDQVILTDAAINPGSQGGPLVSLSGRVLGLLAPLARSSRSGHLTRYAIPIRPVLARLKAALKASRAWLGVVVAEGNALDGLPVSYVQPGSPAARAGILAGDRLRRLGETTISRADELARELANARPGQELRLVIRRQGAVLVIVVKLERRP